MDAAEMLRSFESVPSDGGTFALPFANVVPFADGLMADERVYFDSAMLCEQARIFSTKFGGCPTRSGRARA